MSSPNLYAPPLAEVSDPLARPMAPAGRGARILARCVDCLLLIVAYWPLVLSRVGMPATSHTPTAAMLGSVGLLALMGLLICNCSLLHRRGQTLGKLIFGIQIVRQDGTLASLSRLFFVRSGINTMLLFVPLLGAVSLLGSALMIFGRSQRCLHDRIADTRVVRLAPGLGTQLGDWHPL